MSFNKVVEKSIKGAGGNTNYTFDVLDDLGLIIRLSRLMKRRVEKTRQGGSHHRIHRDNDTARR